MGDAATAASWRALHGGLVLVLLLVVPQIFGPMNWPLPLLVPLTLDGLIVLCVRPLRRSLGWLRAGHLNGRSLLATLATILVSSAALGLFTRWFPQDAAEAAQQLPHRTTLPLLVCGASFALVNAFLEEMLFRGILLDALESQIGPLWALLVQGVVFGVAHMHGVPSGVTGVIMAAIYGCWLGLLRQWTRGLLAPYLAHVCADATIFVLLIPNG